MVHGVLGWVGSVGNKLADSRIPAGVILTPQPGGSGLIENDNGIGVMLQQ
jgi:hypothetical protein